MPPQSGRGYPAPADTGRIAANQIGSVGEQRERREMEFSEYRESKSLRIY
jgi:hypothetical protein